MQVPRRFEPSASIRLVWPFLVQAKARGKDVSYVAEWLGLTEAELYDRETRVSTQQLADLLALAVERSGERDIGLIAATYVDSVHLGIGEYVARSRSTQREAFQSIMRYLPLLGDGAGFSLEIDGKLARWRFWIDPRLAIHEAAYEFVIAIGLLSARRIGGNAKLAPFEVHFMHPQPASTARHDKLFGCPIRFGAEVTQVVMPTSYLETKLAGADPVLGELLSRQADHMLETLPRERSLSGRVEAELAKRTNLRAISEAQIARKLGMSGRTLLRKLAKEGTNYRALFDRVVRAAALQRIERSEQSFTEIAHTLGFASPQSFHRAIRRWTGTTAAMVRTAAKGARVELSPARSVRKRRASPVTSRAQRASR